MPCRLFLIASSLFMEDEFRERRFAGCIRLVVVEGFGKKILSGLSAFAELGVLVALVGSIDCDAGKIVARGIEEPGLSIMSAKSATPTTTSIISAQPEAFFVSKESAFGCHRSFMKMLTLLLPRMLLSPVI
jgi:hypothetical protein